MSVEASHDPQTATAEPMAKAPKPKQRRGFAAMDSAKRREIASRGGKATHAKGNGHRLTTEEAKTFGALGGKTIAANREHMATIGRKGGQTVSKNPEHMATIGQKGGTKVSQDRDHMAYIGELGGHAKAERRRSTTDAAATPSPKA